ncbi:hypothetical protein IEQ34_024147 [Dendrobium chrysotoxum]|uniref:Chloroplast envelope membrane protein n=1 Tax=Dendrobium chrysotoxum TaxID=161865 RepID=A0AAV7FU97_DENCH|nr:hypothetical protein IEQ34_024147 [Dendrobium chrysotoxum]
MKKKKALASLPYLVSILFLPGWVSLSFHKCLETWVLNWWNTRQSEILLNDIKRKITIPVGRDDKGVLGDTYAKASYRNAQGNKTMVQRHNESHFHIILHFSTNLICFAILSGWVMKNFSFEILGFRNFSITSVIQSKLFDSGSDFTRPMVGN